jgi:peroxiredoxin
MECRRLLVCAGVLTLLGAGPPRPIELRTLDGGEVEIVRGEGAPDLMLHFWATWCPECVEELPNLDLAAKECDPSRLRVIAVNAGEDAELVRRFIAEHALTLPVLIDFDGKAWRKAGLWGIPSNLLWTADGVSTTAGPSSAKRWRARLAELGCAEAVSRPESPEAP